MNRSPQAKQAKQANTWDAYPRVFPLPDEWNLTHLTQHIQDNQHTQQPSRIPIPSLSVNPLAPEGEEDQEDQEDQDQPQPQPTQHVSTFKDDETMKQSYQHGIVYQSMANHIKNTTKRKHKTMDTMDTMEENEETVLPPVIVAQDFSQAYFA